MDTKIQRIENGRCKLGLPFNNYDEYITWFEWCTKQYGHYDLRWHIGIESVYFDNEEDALWHILKWG